MHRGTCKVCGGTFWESSKGARGEDLCDGCEVLKSEFDKGNTEPPSGGVNESFEDWWSKRGSMYPPSLKHGIGLAFRDGWYRAKKDL